MVGGAPVRTLSEAWMLYSPPPATEPRSGPSGARAVIASYWNSSPADVKETLSRQICSSRFEPGSSEEQSRGRGGRRKG